MAPRRQHSAKPFPGPAASIRKPQYLRDFREASYELYKRQETEKVFPHTSPEAAYRRAFSQTLFSAFTTEAAEMGHLEKDFKDVFPVAKLPFKDVDAVGVKKEYVDIYEKIREGFPITFDQLKRANAYNIIRTYKHYEQVNDETTYRQNLWDKLANELLVSKSTRYQSELKLKHLHKSYPSYRTDFTICVGTSPLRMPDAGLDSPLLPVPADRLSNPKKDLPLLPLLLAEVSKYHLHEELAHKDEAKLMVAMNAALLQSIGQCQHLGEPFIRKLRVYGLLIGASGFEVSVMYPDFGTVSPGRRAKPFHTLSMIYRSSRKHWRFSLLDTDIEGTPKTPDLDGSEASAFNCTWDERHEFKPAGKQVPYRFERGTTEALNETDEDEVRARMATAPDLGIDDAEIVKKFDELFKEQAEQKCLWYGNSPINWTGIGVLERLGALLSEEGERIAMGLADKKLDRHDFYFSGWLVELMPKGRTSHMGTSPTRTRTEGAWLMERDEPGSPTVLGKRRVREESGIGAFMAQTLEKNVGHSSSKRRPQPRSWKDENGMLWVSLEKVNSSHELAVYSHPLIQSSPHFPKLRNGNLEADGMLHLTLEKVYSQVDYVAVHFEQWSSEKRQRLTLAKITLDLMGALRTLHASGFVHSDVSPNNVGFNRKTKTWQLYDFDRTLPIEESLAKRRSGGTLGFRSRHVEETGIFRVFDDYIAMVTTCYKGFPVSIFGYEYIMNVFTGLFRKLSDIAKPEDVDLDQCYLEAFEIFCKEKVKTSSSPLETDPTYLAALPIQKAIIDKKQ